MKQTQKSRRQILEFSQWVDQLENEELMLGVTVPHDPPNRLENRQPNGLKIDNYGRFK